MELNMRNNRFQKDLSWYISKIKDVLFPVLLLTAINSITAVLAVRISISTKDVLDTLGTPPHPYPVSQCIFLAIFVLTYLLSYSVASMLNVRFSSRFSISVKNTFYQKIIQKQWLSLTKYHSGDVHSRTSSDINIVSNSFFTTIPEAIAVSVQLILTFLELLKNDYTFAYAVLFLAPLALPVSYFFGRRLKRLAKKQQETNAKVSSFIQEKVQNILVVKTFQSEQLTGEQLSTLQENSRKVTLKTNNMAILLNILTQLSYWTVYFFAIAWGALRLSEGTITQGVVLLFILLSSQLQSGLKSLASAIPTMYSVFASVERLTEIESLDEEQYSSKLWDITGFELISFKDVCFSYEQSPLFKDFNLTICKGESVAVLGPSGEGKTTLLRLLLGLVTPSAGSVTVKTEKNICAVDASTRQFFTYVPQGNTLFSGTVEDNLRLGNIAATQADMIEATKQACIYDLIAELPDGFRTIIGERGAGLSEGQAQRLSIARALLRNSPILLLDEATSALDEAIEETILQNIISYRPNLTCIFVTHRTTAAKTCTREITISNS